MTEYSNIKGEMTECHGQNKYTRRKKKKSKNTYEGFLYVKENKTMTVPFVKKLVL